MTTDNLQEGSEITPEAFADLQKKLAKAEKKLDKAKARAQATMQEIWQLDVKLKEEEERANVAEAKLADLQAGGGGAGIEGASAQELVQLQQDLEQAYEEASKVAELREEIETLREELEKASHDAAQIGDYRDEIELLRDELRNARQAASESEELKSRIEALQKQVEESQAAGGDAEELQSRLDELVSERDSLQSRLDELAGEKDSLASRVQELEEQAQAAPDESEQEEVENLRARLEELSAERETLNARVEELEGQLASGASAAETDEESARALKEAEQLIETLQARLQESDGGNNGVGDTRLEFLESRLSGVRIALHEAEERARQAEERIASVGSSTGAFEDQLAEIQAKVREAEERALEWEERFHASEERAAQAAAVVAEDGGDSEQLLMEFQDRISELETELAEAREAQPDSAELDELREELSRAQDRVSELESAGGEVSLEEHQKLEKELEEIRSELEDARSRAERAEKRADEAASKSDSELVAQMRERLQLSEERGELLKAKAEQASDKLELQTGKFEQLKSDVHRLENELAEAQAEASRLKLEVQEQPKGISLEGGDSRLQEAMQRAREAESRANQFELQLQKAAASLSEYEQRANESDRETQRLAFQDTLTGLPNLNLIRQYLEFTVKQVQRYNRASALLVVDLDRFKLINDAMGFKAGDELLMKVAERLQTAIRESDALGRKGEDEFLILLSELITGDDMTPSEQKTNMIRKNIAIVVNRISECLSRPFNIQGQKFYIRASIGVSICPNDADSSQSMLEHADSAMYHAKETGRGRCVFYNNELHKRQEKRLAMDSQLRLAMEKGEFVLQYQPIIEIIKKRGHIVGVEALLRWNHRLEGLLEPAAFLHYAEETGLIVQLGQWVCRQTCWQLRQWMSQGHSMFASFNVSTRQMLQADLPEMILGSVEEFGLQPGLIFVEVREGANVEEVDLTERVVASLGRAGIRVAIDDFGTGYSSISRMDLNHIQFLKIDPSLVGAVQQDKTKANICEAAVNLAGSLELLAVAEGVETLEQAKYMASIGCRYMQGFHFSRPVDAVQITRMLEEKTHWQF